jgi:hypothetical protein
MERNIGRVVESSASIYLELIREDAPELITKYHLESIEKDLSAAIVELSELRKLRVPDARQAARRSKLEALSWNYWEQFLWDYKARVTKRMAGAKAAQKANRFYTPGNPDL